MSKLVYCDFWGSTIGVLKLQYARDHPQNFWFSRPESSPDFLFLTDAAAGGLVIAAWEALPYFHHTDTIYYCFPAYSTPHAFPAYSTPHAPLLTLLHMLSLLTLLHISPAYSTPHALLLTLLHMLPCSRAFVFTVFPDTPRLSSLSQVIPYMSSFHSPDF